MVIYKKEIIYGELYINQTVGGEFLDFLKEMLKRLSKESIKKLILF